MSMIVSKNNKCDYRNVVTEAEKGIYVSQVLIYMYYDMKNYMQLQYQLYFSLPVLKRLFKISQQIKM